MAASRYGTPSGTAAPTDWFTANAPSGATGPGIVSAPTAGRTMNTSPFTPAAGFTGTTGAPGYIGVAGPNTHWDPTSGQFVPNAPTSGASSTMAAGMPSWLATIYQNAGITPGGPGSGFADWQYWANAGESQASRLAADLAGTGTDQPTGTPGTGPWSNSGRGENAGSGGAGPALTPGPLPQSGYGGFGIAPAPYVPNTWTGGDFTLPTEEQVQSTPGYQTGLDAGLLAGNRSAAAQGTVLNGGTQKALTRYATDYANTNYQNAVNNDLTAYQSRYGQFLDANNTGLAAYNTNVGAQRNAANDYWSELNGLYQTGANLAGGSYKPAASA